MKYNDTEHNLKQKLSYSKTNNWDKLKLSELIEINGPGIYIHYTCRPFEDNVNSEMIHISRMNSLNTLVAAECPIKKEIYDNNITVGKYYGCSWIEKVTIGKNNKILDGAFFQCTSLIELNFEKTSNLINIGILWP